MNDFIQDFNLLPCGVFVTGENREIVYCNKTFASYFDLCAHELVGSKFDRLLSGGSKIFFEQIVLPSLVHEEKTGEIQLNFVDPNKNKLPMIVFSNLDSSHRNSIAWCCYPAEERNMLLDELNSSRKSLEESNARLSRLSKIDPLTGCLNRRELLPRMNTIRKQIVRRQSALGILMLDIDHFKSVNDTYGHAEGDGVLKQFATLLVDNSRIDDVVVRYGGEEFVVLLPDTDTDGLMATAERIHQNMGRIRTKANNITVSIGACFAFYNVNATDDKLIREADAALYESKSSGRDKTTLKAMHSTEPSE